MKILNFIFKKNKIEIDEYDSTPLHISCREGDIQKVKKFITNSNYINKKNRYSTIYPIFEALNSKKNSFEIVELLLKSGADINVYDSFGNTPLHYAVEKEDLRLIKLLIKHGCNINKTYRDDKDTPLHYSFFKKNRKIIDMLISYGADINIKNIYNKTPKDYN